MAEPCRRVIVAVTDHPLIILSIGQYLFSPLRLFRLSDWAAVDTVHEGILDSPPSLASSTLLDLFIRFLNALSRSAIAANTRFRTANHRPNTLPPLRHASLCPLASGLLVPVQPHGPS